MSVFLFSEFSFMETLVTFRFLPCFKKAALCYWLTKFKRIAGLSLLLGSCLQISTMLVSREIPLDFSNSSTCFSTKLVSAIRFNQQENMTLKYNTIKPIWYICITASKPMMMTESYQSMVVDRMMNCPFKPVLVEGSGGTWSGCCSFERRDSLCTWGRSCRKSLDRTFLQFPSSICSG